MGADPSYIDELLAVLKRNGIRRATIDGNVYEFEATVPELDGKSWNELLAEAAEKKGQAINGPEDVTFR